MVSPTRDKLEKLLKNTYEYNLDSDTEFMDQTLTQFNFESNSNTMIFYCLGELKLTDIGILNSSYSKCLGPLDYLEPSFISVQVLVSWYHCLCVHAHCNEELILIICILVDVIL